VRSVHSFDQAKARLYTNSAVGPGESSTRAYREQSRACARAVARWPRAAFAAYLSRGSAAIAAGSTFSATAPTIPSVPETPDLAILADAFHAAVSGRRVVAVEALGPLTVRGTPSELAAFQGQRLERFYRRGKFLWLEFERDRIAVNAMLTGRLQLAPTPGTKKPPKTLFVMRFGSRGEGEGPPVDSAEWTLGADWVPGGDATPELRYRDPTQMGKIYLLPRGVDRAVPGAGAHELGPDADDPALSLDVWRTRIRSHPGELKNLLRNQAFVAGIGNAYADEILYAARLQPFRKRASLAPEEVDELYAATRTTLSSAVATLRERVPPNFETEVRDFLAVHNRGGMECPSCGHRITQTEAGGFVTSYCRHCQR
jgi:formamidopyrimidine-DNA glycosylase